MRSNPLSSSSRSSAGSCLIGATVLVGLTADDLRTGAGLLLGGRAGPASFSGLRSKAEPLKGVPP